MPQQPIQSTENLTLCEAIKALSDKAVTSKDLTAQYMARIGERDSEFNSIIALNPAANLAAEESDRRRAGNAFQGPLDGIPVLVKDNIDVAGMATTAGSLALTQNVAELDAYVVQRLRQSGAVLVGKTNLSEWANIRSPASVSGWSAVGGFTRNAHAPDRSPSGSSSGSAVAVAAGFTAGAVGTETDGSIVWPSAINGIVGLKPTVGLVSRRGIIPISHTQDTPGPMARTVKDAAMLLQAMAGSDADDPATLEADRYKADYVQDLDGQPLKGVRLGVQRFLGGFNPETWTLFDARANVLRDLGAEIVEITYFDMAPIMRNRLTILITEFKSGVNAYLAQANKAVKARTLSDVIEFNREETREIAYFGQELFEAAEHTRGIEDPIYRVMSVAAQRAAGPDGIDSLLQRHRLNALIAPTNDPAWPLIYDEARLVKGSASTLPATAGYPHLTVPMGKIAGLPVGLSLIGAAWSEAALLRYGRAFEMAVS